MKLSGAVELVRLAKALNDNCYYFKWEYNEHNNGIKAIVNDHIYVFDVSSLGLEDCYNLITLSYRLQAGRKISGWSFHEDNGIVISIDEDEFLFEMS